MNPQLVPPPVKTPSAVLLLPPSNPPVNDAELKRRLDEMERVLGR
jgi:hypothetical protein